MSRALIFLTFSMGPSPLHWSGLRKAPLPVWARAGEVSALHLSAWGPWVKEVKDLELSLVISDCPDLIHVITEEWITDCEGDEQIGMHQGHRLG